MKKPLLVAAFLFLCTLPMKAQSIIATPQLPQVTPSVVYPSESGYTITSVANGGNLQTALTGAACGTVISLAAGGSFTSSGYTLPNTACNCHTDPTKWVIVRSSAYAGGSTRGTRMDPSNEWVNLAYITGTGSLGIAAQTNGNSCYWIGPGLKITNSGATTYNIVILGNSSQTSALGPHDFVLDHVYIAGQEGVNTQHCITGNGNYISVVDTYISGCHYVGADAQAIDVLTGNGPYLWQNNFFSATTEGTMIGGADVYGSPCDVSVKGNHYFKPLAWMINSPTYFGISYPVKDSVEFKNGCRASLTGNVFENTWAAGQNELIIFNDNCSNSFTNGIISDFTWTYNIWKNGPAGTVYGGCAQPAAKPTQKISFHDNLWYNINPCTYGNYCSGGYGNSVNCGAYGPPSPPFGNYDLWHNHETFESSNQYYTAIELNGCSNSASSYVYGLQWKNSIIACGTIGCISGTGTGGNGNYTLSTWAPTADMTYNCWYGYSTSSNYSNSNFNGKQNPANEAAIFVNPGTDWHVSNSSVCHNAASDGLDMGANIPAVLAATANTVQTLANPVTVTTVSPSTFTHSGGTTITITGANFVSGEAQVIIGGAGPQSTVSTVSCSVDTCTVVMSTPISLQVNDSIAIQGSTGVVFNLSTSYVVASVTDSTHFTYTNSGIGTQSWSGGTLNRISPGNPCTSVNVVSSTSITCTTPAASGPVTTGPVSVFESQWGIPVQATTHPSYN